MTPRLSTAQGRSTRSGEHPTIKHPANDNAPGPIVVLTPIGDGIALARALARVLVRRELILANANPDPVHCEDERKAG